MTVRECVCQPYRMYVIGEFRIGDVDRLRILRKFKVQRTQPSLRRCRFSFRPYPVASQSPPRRTCEIAQMHASTRDTHLSGFHAPITSSTSRDQAHVPNLNRPGNWKLKHFDKNTAYYTCSTGHKQIAVQIHSMQEQAKTPISIRCRRLQIKTVRQPRRQNICILDKKWPKLLVVHHTQSTWTCEHQTEHRR